MQRAWSIQEPEHDASIDKVSIERIRAVSTLQDLPSLLRLRSGLDFSSALFLASSPFRCVDGASDVRGEEDEEKETARCFVCLARSQHWLRHQW